MTIRRYGDVLGKDQSDIPRILEFTIWEYAIGLKKEGGEIWMKIRSSYWWEWVRGWKIESWTNGIGIYGIPRYFKRI